MSSIYSSDRTDRASARESSKSVGQAIQWAQAWIVDGQNTSTAASTISSRSNPSSKEDELDLDALFKRLDTYTAEVQELEERLKRARSNSEKSDGVNVERFSFEESYTREMNKALTPPGPTSISSSTVSRHHHASSNATDEDEGQAPVDSPSSLSKSSPSKCATSSVPLESDKAPVEDDARTEAIAAFQDHGQPPEAREDQDDPQPGVSGDWRAWAEQRIPSPQPEHERSRSKFSERMDSIQTSPNRRFFWKTLSPSPPLKETRRSPTLREAHTPDSVVEGQAERELEYDEYLLEDDEAGPSVPTSWSLLPRSSSKRVMSNESLPPRSSSKRAISDEVVQEQESTAPRPTPRRRTTTSDGRPSIRNGGFWSNPGVGVFDQGDVPPVPALSQSTSNATLTSSPPLTPLTIGGPREDQLRRELETLSIQDGAEVLEHRYKKRRPPMLNLLDSDDEGNESTPMPTSLRPDHSGSLHEGEEEEEDDERGLRPRPRRRKSIFSIFQRKSPVEKLIDMYFDDEPEKKPIPKRRSTWSRKGSPVQEKMPMSPAIPPQFQALHEKQSSL
ncbi:hypothetical protein G647_03247 [Cladophialophora carrionii CBS 160.54]|uniref:Uncharacterized protein n=1 Tax=Cladophialophora carrionii CBS 160.54 TaxID=1279043 RepID=V9DHY8_9EURO|nr:uncharacterized protein G647_03247 [Cladophialophora carrionii CBS 160.54]ETI26470.1 hypothetical protein G647_03247 [Cladophialophora carrionii CBS 160.54]